MRGHAAAPADKEGELFCRTMQVLAGVLARTTWNAIVNCTTLSVAITAKRYHVWSQAAIGVVSSQVSAISIQI